MKHIIVGVDPGKMAALACLDLSGKVVKVESARFGGFDWFVDKIRKSGTPVIIASDKKNPTGMVSRIAATFGSKIHLPYADMSVAGKESAVENFLVSNLHERDALASALAAYNAHANKFKQAEKLAREGNYSDVDRLKAMVVMKYSIHDTITNKKAGKRA